MNFQTWWKPVAVILGAVVLAATAWTKGSDIVGSSFIATDAEVSTAVGKVTKRIDDTVDPQLIELAGAVEILAKGQASSELSSLNSAIQQADTQLFDVRERRKADPLNPDAKARELQLIRMIDGLTQDQRRAKCFVDLLNGKNLRC